MWCPDAPLRRGDLLYVPSERHLCCRGLTVVLRPAADAVLRQLLQPGAAVTRYATLLVALDGVVADGSDMMAALRVTVFALRHHLRIIGSQAGILVVSRAGYRLVASDVWPDGTDVRHAAPSTAAWPVAWTVAVPPTPAGNHPAAITSARSGAQRCRT